MTNSRFANRSELIGILVLAVFLVVILPLCLDVFRLNLVAKYLTYAFVALGLVICWGYGGILSLGQGVFFGLGGYCMAMFLKLEASSVENTKIQSTPAFPISWTGTRSLAAPVLEAVPQPDPYHHRHQVVPAERLNIGRPDDQQQPGRALIDGDDGKGQAVERLQNRAAR